MLIAAHQAAFISLFKRRLQALHIDPDVIDTYAEVMVFEADKKTSIPMSNQTDSWYWLLYSGVVRGYVIESNKEVTCELLDAGKFIQPVADTDDLHGEKKASNMHYETLSRCILLRLPQAMVQSTVCQPLLLTILAQYLADKVTREQIMMTGNAKHRIERLRLRLPSLYTQVSQKYLASFIAISSEAYSRNK